MNSIKTSVINGNTRVDIAPLHWIEFSFNNLTVKHYNTGVTTLFLLKSKSSLTLVQSKLLSLSRELNRDVEEDPASFSMLIPHIDVNKLIPADIEFEKFVSDSRGGGQVYALSNSSQEVSAAEAACFEGNRVTINNELIGFHSGEMVSVKALDVTSEQYKKMQSLIQQL